MKKSTPMFLALTFVVISLAFNNMIAEAAKITITANVSSNPKANPDLPMIHWYQTFQKEMEARVPEKVNVRLYWDSQLARTYADGVNGVQNNIIQMSNIPASSLAEYSKAMIPMSSLFVIPYPHNEIAHIAFTGPLGDTIRKKVIEDTGLRIIFFADYGFRHLLSKNKPITTMDDFNGMKLRSQPNPIQLATFKAFGANPTPISWSELFTALQQGVVSGTENPLINIYQARLYEVTKYLSLTGHLLEFNLLFVNEKWYQDLPADVRDAFDQSIVVADKVFAEKTEELESKLMKIAEEKMEVHEVPESEIAKMREIGGAVSREEVIKEVGQDYYDYFMGEMSKAEQEYFSNKNN